MARFRDTGWPTISNVVSTQTGNTELLPAPGAGRRYVLLGAVAYGACELREDNGTGTIITVLSQSSSGSMFPTRVNAGDNAAIYLNQNVAMTLWYIVETI